jgi:hypothetical protein
MKNKGAWIPLLLLLCFSLIGCQDIIKPVVSQALPELSTSTIQAANTITQLPTPSATQPPATLPAQQAKLTRTPFVFWTPEPTLFWTTWTPEAYEPLPTLAAKVDKLDKNNNGCQLPCWWGIEPGKTNLIDAMKILSPISKEISIQENKRDRSLDIEFHFPIMRNNKIIYASQQYFVKDNIIQRVEIPSLRNEKFLLSHFLKEYGAPEEAWIQGLIDPTSQNPFILYIYYSQKGMLASFDFNGVLAGENLKLCPGNKYVSKLVLRSPQPEISFLDFIWDTNDLRFLRNENYLFRFNEITKTQITTLADQSCFDTLKSIWPYR